MPVNYQIIDCCNPAGAAGTDYMTCRETASRMVTFDDICKSISEMCSMTLSDVKGIVSAYLFQIGQHVAEGSQVTIKGIGTFRPGIKSRAFLVSQISAEGFKPASYIEAKRVKFRVDPSLKAQLRSRAEFRLVVNEFAVNE